MYFVLLRVVLENHFLSPFRKPRAGCSVFCLRSVHWTRLDPAGPGAKGFLPNWLQTFLCEKTSSGAGERQRQQRQRWWFGHHFGPVCPQAPQVREDFEHERLHFGRGAGASSAAGGTGAHHPGDLDERPAGHPRDQEPQPLLLSDGESNRPALHPGAPARMIEEREGRNIMWVSPLFLSGVLPGAVCMDSNKTFPVSFSLTYCYHPSSWTLSGYNRGGCQLHFLVAGRKVTIIVLPCGTWNLACCSMSAPLLAGERNCPGFAVHLGFFGFSFLRTVGELWTKWQIWKDDLGREGEVRPDRLSCDFRSHEINLIKTQQQIWLVKNWGMGGRGILPLWNHLGAWMFAIVYSVIYGCLFIFLFNGNIFFFFTDTSGIKSYYFFESVLPAGPCQTQPNPPPTVKLW